MKQMQQFDFVELVSGKLHENTDIPEHVLDKLKQALEPFYPDSNYLDDITMTGNLSPSKKNPTECYTFFVNLRTPEYLNHYLVTIGDGEAVVWAGMFANATPIEGEKR